MSHGPKLSLHLDHLNRKDKNEIKELMQVAEIGDEEERTVAAEYLNKQLSKIDGHLFGFWNHRPNQEIEDYDDLIEYFRLYARIACQIKCCTAIVTADYKDHRWLYDADKEWEIEEDNAEDRMEWLHELELKKQVRKGKEAEEKLDEITYGVDVAESE